MPEDSSSIPSEQDKPKSAANLPSTMLKSVAEVVQVIKTDKQLLAAILLSIIAVSGPIIKTLATVETDRRVMILSSVWLLVITLDLIILLSALFTMGSEILHENIHCSYHHFFNRFWTKIRKFRVCATSR